MRNIFYTTTFILLLGSNAMAKRNAPEEVPPIATDQAVISVPHFAYLNDTQNGGVVEARHPKTKKLLWRIQIYKPDYDKGLAQDVQDVFIKTLSFDKSHNLLIMSDEKSRVFVLNLTTKRVTQIK
jgi:hypothetical protein